MSFGPMHGMSRHTTDGAHAPAHRHAQQQQQQQHERVVDARASQPASSGHALGLAMGVGSPLAPPVRAEMESRFGTSFAAVRVHDEPAAHGVAQQQMAQAFTVGNHIAFNRVRYAPGTDQGKHLLAHELAHVVQQRRGGTAPPSAQGAALEHAADSAASAVVGGAGPVAVAGASAVGIARQPLPDPQAASLPVPHSLTNSLAKDEKALDDVALRREIDRIEDWLIQQQWAPDPQHLLSELELLHAEKRARKKRRDANAPKRPQPEPGSAAFLADMVHKGAQDADEVAQAHRHYLATGKIPQTDTPFSHIEIRRGVPMSRAQRYDAMMFKQGKPMAQVEDVTVADNRDPDYLTKQEFHDEFFARVHAEYQVCDDEHWFKGPTNDCMRDVDVKYGGPAFKSWRDNKEWQMALRIQAVSEKIEGVVNSGPVSTLGRVVGYGAGSLTGHDALQWSEYGGDIGGWGDLAAGIKMAQSERARLRNYSSSGGQEVGRDADIVWFDPRASTPTPTPTPTPTGPSSRAQAQPAPDLPAPIPITSGKGLLESAASKQLAANLAKQSAEKAGVVTPLRLRKTEPLPQSDAAEQAIPEVVDVSQKIAVGQTHAPDNSANRPAATAKKPAKSTAAPRVGKVSTQTAPSGSSVGKPAASKAAPAKPRVAAGTNPSPNKPEPKRAATAPTPGKTTSAKPKVDPKTEAKTEPRTPDDEFNDFQKTLSDEFGAKGELASGKLIELYRHGSRATVVKYVRQVLMKQAEALRKEAKTSGNKAGSKSPHVLELGDFKLELQPGKSVKKQIDDFVKKLEGAHSMPQAFGKRLPSSTKSEKYNPDDALVQFTDKPVHTEMDQPWKDAFNALHKSGQTETTAGKVFDMVADGIRKTPGMAEDEKVSRIARLRDEMFKEMKLDPNRRYSVPRVYTWFEILGFKARGKAKGK
jgi:Domain of unknown function (DUF4157)